MKPTLILLSFLSIAGLATAADSAAPAEAAAPAATKAARPSLELGMPAEQVLQIAGKPKRVKKLDKEGLEAEVWYYDFNRPHGMKQVATDTREIPYVDPITGVEKMLKEPVYSLERVYLVETTELLIINGVLAESKRYRQVKGDMHD